MDTFYSTKAKLIKSISQNTFCQIFVTNNGYVCVCPLEKESDALLAMKIFSKEIGMPEALATDGSKAETSADVTRFCINIGTRHTIV